MMRIPTLVGGPCEGRYLPDRESRPLVSLVMHSGPGVPMYEDVLYSLTRLGHIEAFVYGSELEQEERVSRLSRYLFDRAVPEQCDDGNTTNLWGYEATLVLKDHTGQRLEMPLPIYINPADPTRFGVEFQPDRVLAEINKAQREGRFYG